MRDRLLLIAVMLLLGVAAFLWFGGAGLLMVGGAALLPFVPDPTLAVLVALAALGNHGLGLTEWLTHHHSHNARAAAALLPTVEAWPGSRMSAFHTGLAMTTLTSLLSMLMILGGVAEPAGLALCAAIGWVGLFLYERAYVRAGQLPPLS